MTELQIFENPAFGEVRTIEEDGKVLFCGKDVAKALGYSNTQDALSRHCRGVVKRDVGVVTGEKADGTPATQTIKMNFIPEGDIYRLAAKSELPGADKFESWIFDEVLPTIRRTGEYTPAEPMTEAELLSKALLVAQRTLAAQKERVSALEVENSALVVDKAIMQPKAEYFDELIQRQLNTGLRETAKELCVKEKKFVAFLLDKKYLYRDKNGKLQPYAPYIDNLFVMKECFNEKTQWAGTQLLVTPKGRETFRLLFPAAS